MQKLFCSLVFTHLTSVCILTFLANSSVTLAAPTTIETKSESDKWSNLSTTIETTSESSDQWIPLTDWYSEAELWIDETSASSQNTVNDWLEDDYTSVKKWIENSSDMTQEKLKTLERDARRYLEEAHEEIQSFTESFKDRFHSMVNPVKVESYVIETVCSIAGVKNCAECRGTEKTSKKAVVCYVCCHGATEANPLPPPDQDDTSNRMTEWFIETFNWLGLHAVYQYVAPTRKERQKGASVISVIKNFNSRFQKKPITSYKSLNSSIYSNSTFKSEDICGYYTNSKEGRIVGGSHVDSVGLYPWQLSLATMLLGMFYQHRCGATLLSSRWALTAAHCLQEVDLHTTVVMGGFLSQNNHDVAQIIKVEKAFPHAHFDSALYEQDIALLLLARPVVFTSLLLPACLPPPDTDHSGKTAVLTGWGRKWDKGPLTEQLHVVDLPVINNEVCMRWYLQSKSPQNIPVRTFLCAGVEDGSKDACSGDSGGPLVNFRDDKRAEIIGIVSWGIGCGAKGRPGVYTRVSKYIGWIQETMGEADKEEREALNDDVQEEDSEEREAQNDDVLEEDSEEREAQNDVQEEDSEEREAQNDDVQE